MNIPQVVKELLNRFDNKISAFLIIIFISLSVLVFQNDKFGFEKGHHGFLSSHGAAISRNLSADHHFLMFTGKKMGPDSSIEFETYGRFPVMTFLLLKVAMDVAETDLGMQVSIARQVMNLFFLGALLFSFLSIFELTKNYLSALSIALVSFSSAYLNYYNDMIFNDIPALFGFMLAGHGLVLYELYGRKRQMFIKALVGICFGWQTLGILLAYIICAVASNFYQNRTFRSILNNDAVRLGMASFIFAASILSYNLVIESFVTGKSFKQLNTINSAMSRLGGTDEFNKNYTEYLAWNKFSKDQMHRVGAISIPYFFKKGGRFYLYGIVIILLLSIGILFSKQKLLLFTFLISGFVWAFPMRNFTFSHDFQSIFYVGIPLSLYYLIIHFLTKRWNRFSLPIAILSVILFVSTNVTFNISKATASGPVVTVMNDFQNIIDITGKGNTFYIDGNKHRLVEGFYTIDFCLAGNYFSDKNGAEYVISANKEYNPSLLTPENHTIFLFGGKPRFPGAYNRRGLDYLKTGHYALAIADFQKAIEGQNDFVEAYVNLGIAEKKNEKLCCSNR